MTDRTREPGAPEGQPRPENREGQNQSSRDRSGGGQQGQPEERGRGDGERGGNR